MKAQTAAEKLLRTENEHWNGYALRYLVEVKESKLFPKEEDKALELYNAVIEQAVELHEHPLRAEREVGKLLEKLTEAQRTLIYQGAYRYLRGTQYGPEDAPIDLGPVLSLMKVHTKQTELPSWSTTARERLQQLLRSELEALPQTIAQLDPKDRVAVLTRLLPYLLPKAEEQPSPNVTTW